MIYTGKTEFVSFVDEYETGCSYLRKFLKKERKTSIFSSFINFSLLSVCMLPFFEYI